jgi:hypothetical protein
MITKYKFTMKHECKTCGKEYKRESQFLSHHVFCEEMFKCRQDVINTSELPSSQVMFSVMQKLLVKYDQLQKEVTALKKQVKAHSKVTIIDYLKVNMRPSHEELLSLFNDESGIKRQNILKFDQSKREILLDILMEKSYEECLQQMVVYLFKEENIPSYPVQSFTNQSQSVYIYNSKNQEWSQTQKQHLDFFISYCHVYVIDLFREWKREREEEIKDNWFYSNVYVPNMNRVIKANISANQMKTILHNHLKQDVKQFVTISTE